MTLSEIKNRVVNDVLPSVKPGEVVVVGEPGS